MATSLRETIVDTALRLAEERSWEALRLHHVAATCGIGLADIHQHFREKEDIVDAWFDRADRALLNEAGQAEFQALDSRARIERAMRVWLAALAPHRRVTRQMIWNKFEPGHLHYQWTGAKRVSRTVQWLREAAGRDAVLPWRALDEAMLTGVYLTTFFYWMRDDSMDSVRTHSLLARLMRRAERARGCVGGDRLGAGAPRENTRP